jgi:hypothetical protein
VILPRREERPLPAVPLRLKLPAMCSRVLPAPLDELNAAASQDQIGVS